MSERTAVVAAQRPQDSSAVPPQLKLLLKHFLEYADHDVSYNAPGTPPRAMSFAVLGKFFDDTELASALPAAQQAKLIDSIRPPQGRHVTWRDFIIVLQIVAEYRFSGLDDAERLKAIVADLLTKLDRKVTPSAAVAAETGGPIPSAAPPPQPTPMEPRDALRPSAAHGDDTTYSIHQVSHISSNCGEASARRAQPLDEPRTLERAQRLTYYPSIADDVLQELSQRFSEGMSAEEVCSLARIQLSCAAFIESMRVHCAVASPNPRHQLMEVCRRVGAAMFPYSHRVVQEELGCQLLYQGLAAPPPL